VCSRKIVGLSGIIRVSCGAGSKLLKPALYKAMSKRTLIIGVFIYALTAAMACALVRWWGFA
jgi:hypothetical protein